MKKKQIGVLLNNQNLFDRVKSLLEENLNCIVTKVDSFDDKFFSKTIPDMLISDISFAKKFSGESTSNYSYLSTIPLVYLIDGDYDLNMIRLANRTNPADYLKISEFKNNSLDVIEVIGNLLNEKDSFNLMSYFKNKFYSFVNSIDEMVLIVNRELNITNINDYGLRILKNKRSDVIGNKCHKFFSCKKDNSVCPTQITLNDGIVCTKNITFPSLGKTFSVKSIPIKDKNGIIIKIVIMFRDITDYEIAQKKDAELKSFYSNLFNNNHIPMLLIERETGYIYEANPSAVKFYGYSHDEIKTKYIWDINMLPKERVIEKMKNATKLEQQHFLFNHKLADGRIRNVEVYSGPIKIKGKTLLYSIIVDITDRIELQRKLNEKSERLNVALEITSDGVWEWESDTGKLFLSPRFYAMLGYEPYEIKPEVELWTSLIHPDDREKCILNKIKHEEKLHSLHKSKFRIRNKAGDYIYVMSKARIVDYDKDGNPLRIVGSYEDITLLVEKERKLLLSIKEKETLVREVHHRVKNNLQIIISLLKLQSNNIKDPHFRELIKASENRIRTMALVHENLYQTEDFSQINFKSYINRLISNLQYSLSVDKRKFHINLDIDEKIYLNINEAIPVAQIVNELFTNALKYGTNGETPTQVDIILYLDDYYNHNLIIRDSSGKFPKNIDINNPSTMGLQLVVGLTNQINGELTLDANNNHTLFKIKF